MVYEEPSRMSGKFHIVAGPLPRSHIAPKYRRPYPPARVSVDAPGRFRRNLPRARKARIQSITRRKCFARRGNRGSLKLKKIIPRVWGSVNCLQGNSDVSSTFPILTKMQIASNHSPSILASNQRRSRRVHNGPSRSLLTGVAP